jgi:chromosomal replication initiation ATPase DnaA
MVINARKIVWYFMREYFGTNISFEKLGKIYGKSHSNASQMVNSLIGEMQFNNGLRQEIKEIKQLIDDFIVNTNAAIC